MPDDKWISRTEFWRLVATGVISLVISLASVITYAETRVAEMIAEKSPYIPDKKAIEQILATQKEQLSELNTRLTEVTRSVDKLTATIEAKVK